MSSSSKTFSSDSSQLTYLQAVENHYLFWPSGPDCFIRLGVTIPDESGTLEMEIGHMRWDNSPNWKHQSFSFPRGAMLFIYLRPPMVCCFSCWIFQACWYGSPLMGNLSLTSQPLTIEVLGDLLSLISIRTHLMFPRVYPTAVWCMRFYLLSLSCCPCTP